MNLIENFEEIGWSDPTVDNKVGTKKAIEWLRKINFYDFIYPMDLSQMILPPKCIFVPEKNLLRKLIRAVGESSSK